MNTSSFSRRNTLQRFEANLNIMSKMSHKLHERPYILSSCDNFSRGEGGLHYMGHVAMCGKGMVFQSFWS